MSRKRAENPKGPVNLLTLDLSLPLLQNVVQKQELLFDPVYGEEWATKDLEVA